MVYRKIINFLLHTRRGQALIVIFSIIITVFVIFIISMLNQTNQNKVNDTVTSSMSGNIVDKSGQLISALGLDRHSMFIDKVYEFLNSKGLGLNSSVTVNNVKTYDRDSNLVDVYLNIPDLNQNNLLVKLYFDYDREQYMFTIPDYQYESFFSTKTTSGYGD